MEYSILIVEDDTVTCNNFRDILADREDFNLIGITNDAFKAIELAKEYIPDAIILDLELTDNGKGNGIQFLLDLSNIEITYKPFILVTTNNNSEVILNTARNLGADFFLRKCQKDYSERMVLDFLEMVLPARDSSNLTSNIYNITDPLNHEKQIKNIVLKELNLIGVNPKYKGYNYLVDSISEAILHPDDAFVDSVSKMYNKTRESVMRAMQNTINSTWTTSDIESLLKHYTAKISVSRATPTVTEFVRYYSCKIRANLTENDR